MRIASLARHQKKEEHRQGLAAPSSFFWGKKEARGCDLLWSAVGSSVPIIFMKRVGVPPPRPSVDAHEYIFRHRSRGDRSLNVPTTRGARAGEYRSLAEVLGAQRVHQILLQQQFILRCRQGAGVRKKSSPGCKLRHRFDRLWSAVGSSVPIIFTKRVGVPPSRPSVDAHEYIFRHHSRGYGV